MKHFNLSSLSLCPSCCVSLLSAPLLGRLPEFWGSAPRVIYRSSHSSGHHPSGGGGRDCDAVSLRQGCYRRLYQMKWDGWMCGLPSVREILVEANVWSITWISQRLLQIETLPGMEVIFTWWRMAFLVPLHCNEVMCVWSLASLPNGALWKQWCSFIMTGKRRNAQLWS